MPTPLALKLGFEIHILFSPSIYLYYPNLVLIALCSRKVSDIIYKLGISHPLKPISIGLR
jgi:hypothetical protein